MNANEMSLSIKIGEHAVDVAGPVHEVWKVLEVFQRLSGFDPQEIARKRELDYYNQMSNQINAAQVQQLRSYAAQQAKQSLFTAPLSVTSGHGQPGDITPGAADPSWVKKLLGGKE